MLCQKCQKRMATYLVTQVLNNQETKAYLCEECASYMNSGININLPSIIDDIVTNIVGFNKNTTRSQVNNIPQRKVCEKCGMSFDEFQNNGKLGCENCYSSFYEMLIPVVRRLQKSSKHVGKYPSSLKEKLVHDKEKEALKLQLKEAVEKEEYELAAKIRDKIKTMEGSL